jgi:hypothetical protein
MSMSALCFQAPRPVICFDRNQFQFPLQKIQAICNGKSAPFAMQTIASTREKVSAQEQWGINGKTMRRAMGAMKIQGMTTSGL